MRACRSRGSPLLLLIALAAARAAAGADVNLAWDPSGDPSVVSYKVYYGTASRAYSSAITVGLTPSCTIGDLAPGTFYFAVTAVSASGLESGFSNEVSTSIAGLPLSIVGVRDPSWIDPTRAVIAWITNRASDSSVEYGIVSAAETSILQNEPDPVTSHSVLLDGLIPGETYDATRSGSPIAW